MVILDGYYEYYEPPHNHFMLAHNGGVEYADYVWDLDYSVINPFNVWSVHVDYGHRQVCIALVTPLSADVPDTAYAFGVEKQDCVGYVDGAAFVPGVIRARLTDLAIEGEYDAYGFRLPCVTVKPVEALTSKVSEASLVPSTLH